MPRGRRKPIEQHVLEGTYRPDRHGPLSPDDRPEPPPPKPESLTGRAGEVWAELMPLLPAGTVKARDVPLLVELCHWLERSERVAERVRVLKAEDRGFVQALVAAGVTTDKVLALASRFGMSPVDRAKLRAVAAPVPPQPRVRTRQPTALDRMGKPT